MAEGGEIIERGKHSQLLAQQGFYYSLYMSQFRRQEETAPQPAPADDPDGVALPENPAFLLRARNVGSEIAQTSYPHHYDACRAGDIIKHPYPWQKRITWDAAVEQNCRPPQHPPGEGRLVGLMLLNLSPCNCSPLPWHGQLYPVPIRI
ncbi:MAG: hypothetical protein U0401_27305 [Anaerolineae bacterium]